MVLEKKTVLLSSTVLDFLDTRSILKTRLRRWGFHVLASDCGTIPVDGTKHSFEVCLEAARNCDFMVALIGSRYGCVLPDGKRSIVRAEIEEASNSNRPVYVFVRRGVWDAKEVYKQYLASGYPFLPTKLVSDVRIFDLIDSVRKKERGNWLFFFDSPMEIIRVLRLQLGK